MKSIPEYREEAVNNPPDIALLSLNLPGGQAIDLLTFPAEAGRFPVVIMINPKSKKIIDEVVKPVVLDYMIKSPESFADLAHIISRALSQWELLQEHKRTRDALIQSEAKYHMLMENTSDGIFLADHEGSYKEVNSAGFILLGYTRDEILQKNMRDLVQPDDQPIRFEELRQGKIIISKREMIRKDGSSLPVEISARQFPNGMLQGIVRDISQRKRTEALLWASEERFRSILENTDLGIFESTIKGEIIQVNQAFARLFGFESPEAVKNGLKNVASGIYIYPEKRDEFIRYVLRHPGMAKFENEYRKRDGTHFTASLKLQVLQDPILRHPFLFGYVEDISALKEAQALSQREVGLRDTAFKALHLSEEKFSTAFRISPDSININRLKDGLYIEINEGFSTLTGFTAQDIIGKTSIEINIWVNPQDREKLVNELQEHGQVWNLEAPFRAKNGQIKICLMSARIIEINQEKCILSITRDISERKQAEVLAFKQSEQLRLLYEASQRLNLTLDLDEIYQAICGFMTIIAPNDGFFISAFDHDTQMITCRAYWMDNNWLDVSSFPSIPLEEEGKGTQSIVIRTKLPMIINDYQDQIRTAHSVYYVNDQTNEIVKEIAPEEDVTRSALIVPLKVGGKVTGVIQVMSNRLNAYSEDQLKLLEALALHIASAKENAQLYAQVQTELSEHNRAEERILQLNNELEQRVRERTSQLESANLELEAFSYSVSHDLRSPLRTMEGFSHILQTDYSNQLDPQGMNYLNRIQTAAQHMEQLINDLLNLSRISQVEFICQPVDLSAMAHEIALELKERDTNRQVDFDIANDMVVLGDTDMIRIALNNLFDNAYKFTSKKEKAQIKLGSYDQEDERVYYIYDNGSGFDMVHADKLFAPFHRLHSAREYPGTGIGLSIVQRVIIRHGGHIWSESEIGKGTTFYFTIKCT